jgi:nucleoside-diphosphate-sugar epimerase
MRCSVLGAGYFGAPLARELKKSGWEVYSSTRSDENKLLLEESGIKSFILRPPDLPSPSSLKQETIILNIPPFEGQLEWFKSWPWDTRCWIIFISSTSVISTPEAFNSQLLASEEAWIQDTFPAWTILRFGGLLGGERHPGKHLSGKKNLQGRKWPVNLIHQTDAIGVTRKVIEQNLTHKIFNVVSSEHPSRQEFYSEYCSRNGLALPEFADDESTGKIISNEELLPYYPHFQKLW